MQAVQFKITMLLPTSSKTGSVKNIFIRQKPADCDKTQS